MIRILTIIILLFNKSLISQDFKLVCSEINSSLDIGLSRDFSKIVNFKDQTIVNYSGGVFDNVILFDHISDLSSTIIRKKIFSNKTIDNDTPIEIVKYITDNNLYKNGK